MPERVSIDPERLQPGQEVTVEVHGTVIPNDDGSVNLRLRDGSTWGPYLPATARFYDAHDPSHGRIDLDIQRQVDDLQPTSLGQRVAMENTLQHRRNQR